ncbi:electron transport complex subunit RsxG [Zoogloeaceae bacterium G21618-S1]|nr:electron transport complex subunit RsxG [Zoogloeaceae bacterium G21618-S1]
MSTEYTAARTSIRTALILTLFASLFTAAMALTYRYTKPAIDTAVAEVKRKLIAEVLAPESYDNALLDDVVTVLAPAELGIDEGSLVYRARKRGEPVALIVEARAPDGYGGGIDLIVAVGADGRLTGVRATAHKETPGLGDYVDPRKDPNKTHPWINQFVGRGLTGSDTSGWKVRKDGGDFDARAGATISARAVIAATARALAYADANQHRLFDAKTGERITAAANAGAKP